MKFLTVFRPENILTAFGLNAKNDVLAVVFARGTGVCALNMGSEVSPVSLPMEAALNPAFVYPSYTVVGVSVPNLDGS